VPPLNLVGDFGGGGMLLAFGVVCALLEAQKSGRGQVVDAAMVDGAACLMALIYGMFAQGAWSDERGVNVLDTGAPWYDAYETKDGKWLAVGAIEARFYAEFIERLGLSATALPAQHDRSGWPELRRRFAETIRQRTREDWERVFAGSDACVAPVLSLAEVRDHPHNVARSTFVERDGVVQPAPAPRFSRTAAEIGAAPRPRGADSEAILRDWGFAVSEIDALRIAGVIGTTTGAT
jgi:alpha-methylacyl-CoA racemase